MKDSLIAAVTKAVNEADDAWCTPGSGVGGVRFHVLSHAAAKAVAAWHAGHHGAMQKTMSAIKAKEKELNG